MASSLQQSIPADIGRFLDRFATDLRTDAPGNVLGVILFGGLARGRYVQGVSDVNLVLYLRDASAGALAPLAARLHEAWRTHRVEPFIVTADEISRLSVVFPTKMLDIQRRHVVLAGDSPFDSLEVDQDHVRLRVEQELRNLVHRLRHRFVRVSDDPLALTQAASDAVPALAVNLRALLQLRAEAPAAYQPTLRIFELAARTFELDAEVLATAKGLHERADAPAIDAAMFGRLLATVARAADVAATRG